MVRQKNLRAVALGPDHPESRGSCRPARALVHRRPSHARSPLTCSLWISRPVMHRVIPLRFHKGRRVRREVGEVPLQDKGFGLVPNVLQKAVDRLALRRYVHADFGTIRIREAPNSSERGADRLSGAGSPDTKPSGNGRRGAVPELRCRTRFRTRCGTTGAGPARGRRTGAKVSPEEEPRGARSRVRPAKATRGFLASGPGHSGVPFPHDPGKGTPVGTGAGYPRFCLTPPVPSDPWAMPTSSCPI
jgi:hypothetical protein